MRLLGKELLHNFKQIHADARSQIESWEVEVEEMEWETPHDLKKKYPKASILGNQQVLFNICGNKYRLLIMINYKNGIVLVNKIDTHDEYNKWKIN